MRRVPSSIVAHRSSGQSKNLQLASAVALLRCPRRHNASYDGPAPQRQEATRNASVSAKSVTFAEPEMMEHDALAGQQYGSMVAPSGTDKSSVAIHSDPEVAMMAQEIDNFFEEKDRQMSEYVRKQNAENVKLPPRPEELIPAFERVKRSAKMLVRFNDPDEIVHEQKWNYVPYQPPKDHPWVPYTKHGKHIVHGDGMLNVVGTGEVGFDNTFNEKTLPTSWRGLKKHSNVGEKLPLKNGSTLQDAVVKYSLSLTGKGVFATRNIKKGELIMIVDSTAQNVGYNDEQSRMIAMTAQILKSALAGGEEEKQYLHNWILTGQLSSYVERWRKDATEKVIEMIGGEANLEKLELHREHIPRIASIIHMNGFLVESAYAERRGVAYWPEASLLNHSCEPNTTYEIVPEQMFTQSEFYMGTSDQELMTFESDNIHAAMGTTPTTPAGSSSSSDDSSTPKQGGGCGDPRCTDSACTNTASHAGTTAAGDGGSATTSSSSLTTTGNDALLDGSAEKPQQYTDLTPEGANTFLFCARATKDVAAGEEILISYIPTEWPFSHRQEVLLERYKFRCKCPRCSPDIDTKHNFMTKFLLPTLAMTLVLHLLLSMAMADTEHDDNIDMMKWKMEHSNVLPGTVSVNGHPMAANDPYSKLEH